MRVAIISTFPPIECGIGTYSSYLHDALKAKRCEMFVVSQLGAQGNNVFPVYQPGSPSMATDIFTVTDKITPDVVHIQHEFGLYGDQRGVHVVELIIRYRIAGEPVAVTLHTVNPNMGEPEKIVLDNIAWNASAIIVHEDYQKEIIYKFTGRKDNVFVIPHGVREVESVPDAKERLELTGKKVLLLCGYFRPTKGFDKIVDLFPQIAEGEDDFRLLIAGKSRGLEFRDYQRDFYDKINNSPALDKMMVLRGQFPQYTFDTILSAGDVVAMPYSAGAQSGIMAQCFAFNKPVVASNLPAFQRAMQQSGGGVCCESDEDYIREIRTLLNDEAKREAMKNNIADYKEKSVGWKKVSEMHLEVYRKIARVPFGKAKYVYWPEPNQ